MNDQLLWTYALVGVLAFLAFKEHGQQRLGEARRLEYERDGTVWFHDFEDERPAVVVDGGGDVVLEDGDYIVRDGFLHG
jgi:hypothetical protein